MVNNPVISKKALSLIIGFIMEFGSTGQTVSLKLQRKILLYQQFPYPA